MKKKQSGVWRRRSTVECSEMHHLLRDRISSDKTVIFLSFIDGSWTCIGIGGESVTLPNSIPPAVLSTTPSLFHEVVLGIVRVGLTGQGSVKCKFSFGVESTAKVVSFCPCADEVIFSSFDFIKGKDAGAEADSKSVSEVESRGWVLLN